MSHEWQNPDKKPFQDPIGSHRFKQKQQPSQVDPQQEYNAFQQSIRRRWEQRRVLGQFHNDFVFDGTRDPTHKVPSNGQNSMTSANQLERFVHPSPRSFNAHQPPWYDGLPIHIPLGERDDYIGQDLRKWVNQSITERQANKSVHLNKSVLPIGAAPGNPMKNHLEMMCQAHFWNLCYSWGMYNSIEELIRNNCSKQEASKPDTSPWSTMDEFSQNGTVISEMPDWLQQFYKQDTLDKVERDFQQYMDNMANNSMLFDQSFGRNAHEHEKTPTSASSSSNKPDNHYPNKALNLQDLSTNLVTQPRTLSRQIEKMSISEQTRMSSPFKDRANFDVHPNAMFEQNTSTELEDEYQQKLADMGITEVSRMPDSYNSMLSPWKHHETFERDLHGDMNMKPKGDSKISSRQNSDWQAITQHVHSKQESSGNHDNNPTTAVPERYTVNGTVYFAQPNWNPEFYQLAGEGDLNGFEHDLQNTSIGRLSETSTSHSSVMSPGEIVPNETTYFQPPLCEERVNQPQKREQIKIDGLPGTLIPFSKAPIHFNHSASSLENENSSSSDSVPDYWWPGKEAEQERLQRN